MRHLKHARDHRLEWRMKSDNQLETPRIFAVNQRKSADCLEDNSTNCQKGGLSRGPQWQLWT